MAIVIATAIFYLAKDIFIPFAVASVLALVLSQVVNRLERIVGRLIGALVVVAVAVVAVTAIGYLLTVELTSVAVELTAYSDNIAAKLSAVEKTTPIWLQRIEDAVKDVELQLQRSNPRPKQPKTTVTEAPAASFQQMMKPALPLLAGIADALLVIVLLFFLLYESRPLRARLVRLAARARITISAEAIDTASEVVGRYLLLYSLTNLAFGTAIYIVTLVLGLPHP
jgi:predicted PurR-regulated permease PerM